MPVFLVTRQDGFARRRALIKAGQLSFWRGIENKHSKLSVWISNLYHEFIGHPPRNCK